MLCNNIFNRKIVLITIIFIIYPVMYSNSIVLLITISWLHNDTVDLLQCASETERMTKRITKASRMNDNDKDFFSFSFLQFNFFFLHHFRCSSVLCLQTVQTFCYFHLCDIYNTHFSSSSLCVGWSERDKKKSEIVGHFQNEYIYMKEHKLIKCHVFVEIFFFCLDNKSMSENKNFNDRKKESTTMFACK